MYSNVGECIGHAHGRARPQYTGHAQHNGQMAGMIHTGRPQGAVCVEADPGRGLHGPSDLVFHALNMAHHRPACQGVCASSWIGTWPGALVRMYQTSPSGEQILIHPLTYAR